MIQIYHNPRCSKSRETLALLQARGLEPEVIDYLQTPPSVERLLELQRRLRRPAREMLRSGEETYAELGLDEPALDEAALLAAVAAHPVLLQRPIVVNGDRAVIARPSELALTVLD
ncbi:arsenate reductase (glutaredoxin) [Roseateles violae]|uniref:Arsenate reductase n=1 Tax=Roseateles violae TaxID=3058042 RepID=A0ABT8DWH9_9BURK|nr:arsenate reductase (glutaredoxin) [Pelomonas sp. PFR6]MDN3920747.1 arsenate reductase (glutaredoxin) [Pelomonas sp. PFR6]